mmetsp:Transcript_8471/g.20389  ORF Transcript_8471/g.20389 Transcript_8471/m.20389 type:complete len:180 (-) Transcript_8471:44-583(-)|eukprot:g9127.t1
MPPRAAGRGGDGARRRAEDDGSEPCLPLPAFLLSVLPEYVAFHLHERFTINESLRICYTLLWISGAVFFRSQLYIIITGIAFVFLSLGARSGDVGSDEEGVSAYSVFNRGARHLLGDLRGDQIDREHRGIAHMGGGGGGRGGDDDYDYAPQFKSKDANKPCPCGSGKKLKKCCGSALRY